MRCVKSQFLPQNTVRLLDCIVQPYRLLTAQLPSLLMEAPMETVDQKDRPPGCAARLPPSSVHRADVTEVSRPPPPSSCTKPEARVRVLLPGPPRNATVAERFAAVLMFLFSWLVVEVQRWPPMVVIGNVLSVNNHTPSHALYDNLVSHRTTSCLYFPQ